MDITVDCVYRVFLYEKAIVKVLDAELLLDRPKKSRLYLSKGERSLAGEMIYQYAVDRQ